MENVKHLLMEANVLKRLEQEMVFSVSPPDFYKLAEEYVFYKDLQKLLKNLEFDVYEIVRNDKLSELCSRVKTITSEELENLVKQLENLIKINKLQV